MTIRQLPPELVREIAAGEVISSPVDVLKELLENALDAGATRLDVGLDAGGTAGISVEDNGEGIAKDELAQAAEAHFTSKLQRLDDITTLGFRGEGLYAIRHAGTLHLRSRPARQLGGATLEARGESSELTLHPAPAGSRAVVTELFARLPARRRALGTPTTEERRCVLLLMRYLLHHPQLSVHLSCDGAPRWHYSGGELRDAVSFFWGPLTANRLFAAEAQQNSYKLSGLLSRPELSRAKRDRLVLAVNGRPVEWNPELLQALLRAYRDMLGSNQFPVGVINLSLDPHEVMVNTAPDKRFVRFLEVEKMAKFLEQEVALALAGQTLAPSAPLPRSTAALSSAPRHNFPQLSYLGNFQKLYLLAEHEDELWIVDQHAAHERIIFEGLERRYRAEAPVELPHTELLPLAPSSEAIFRSREADLSALGLGLEPFGAGRYRVRSVPAFLLGYPELIPAVVEDSLKGDSSESAWRTLLARLACLPAIKAGQPLDGFSAQALLDALQACQTPWSCPHGRPTALLLPELELARRFGRRSARATQKKHPAAAVLDDLD